MAETGAGSDGILKVKLGGVIPADGSSNSTLSMLGIAVVDAALGDDEHATLLFSEQGKV
jgi:hypothetical protein